MVHLYGRPCEVSRIAEIAGRKKIHLIEDCAQSLGATYNHKPTGSFGILSCFSFYPTKNLGGIGDAGAISTNNKELLTRQRKYTLGQSPMVSQKSRQEQYSQKD
jgi:dTDP-4-amino-4,6-dideoxygalactose transaminase